MKATGNLTLSALLFFSPGWFGSKPQSQGLFPGLVERLKPSSITTQAPADKKCSAAYQRLYGRSDLDIRVVFGYKDARPARFVGDRHERIAFVQQILQPCTQGHAACGFSRTDDDADRFWKSIVTPEGKTITIRMLIAHSSVSPDDSENRKDSLQVWQSRYAEGLFLRGLEEADIVFYNGHSRSGGGPDFHPPHLTAAESVDYTYYEKRRPGLARILNHIKNPQSGGAKILGIFSCASSQHFSDQILEKNPKIGLISSRSLLYYADALENSLAALSAIIEMRCPKSFKAAIRHESFREGSQIQGFFAE